MNNDKTLPNLLERELDELRGIRNDLLGIVKVLNMRTERLYWKSRIDCWYEPHSEPNQKQKADNRLLRYVILEAPDKEQAIKAALEWAEKTAPKIGRRWLGFEHRFTGPVRFPLEVRGGDT